MSDKLVSAQDSSIELSEQDLDTVAGGFALSLAEANGVAFGDNTAVTANRSNTQAISLPGFNLAAGQTGSASFAS